MAQRSHAHPQSIIDQLHCLHSNTMCVLHQWVTDFLTCCWETTHNFVYFEKWPHLQFIFLFFFFQMTFITSFQKRKRKRKKRLSGAFSSHTNMRRRHTHSCCFRRRSLALLSASWSARPWGGSSLRLPESSVVESAWPSRSRDSSAILWERRAGRD